MTSPSTFLRRLPPVLGAAAILLVDGPPALANPIQAPPPKHACIRAHFQDPQGNPLELGILELGVDCLRGKPARWVRKVVVRKTGAPVVLQAEWGYQPQNDGCSAAFRAHAAQELDGEILAVERESPEKLVVDWLPRSDPGESCPNEKTFTLDCDPGEHFEAGLCVPEAALHQQRGAKKKRASASKDNPPVDPQDLVRRAAQASDPNEAKTLLTEAKYLGFDVSAELHALGPRFAQRSRDELRRAQQDATTDPSGSSTSADLMDAQADAQRAADLGADVGDLQAQCAAAAQQQKGQDQAWRTTVQAIEIDLRAQQFVGGQPWCADCPTGRDTNEDLFSLHTPIREGEVTIALYFGGPNGGRKIEVDGLFRTSVERQAVRTAVVAILNRLAPDSANEAADWSLRTAAKCPIEDGARPAGCDEELGEKNFGTIRAQVASADNRGEDASGHRLRGFRAIFTPLVAAPAH